MTTPEPQPTSIEAASTARAALQRWLEHTDDLLRKQRARSISPAHEGWERETRSGWTAILSELRSYLPALLDRLSAALGRWILILDTGPADRHYYDQFIAFEDGSLHGKAVSDHFLAPAHSLGDGGFRALTSMGWQPPNGTGNWRLVDATITPDTEAAARMAIWALATVYGAGEEATVRVELFDSPRRGNTPASSMAGNASRAADANT